MRIFSSRAFTLIELLVSIAIIGVLIVISFSAVGNLRQRALATQSLANVRQIYTGFAGYALENNNQWPAPQPRWSNAILPFVVLAARMEASNDARSVDAELENSIFISPGWDTPEMRAAFSDADQFFRKGYGMNILLPDEHSVGARFALGASTKKDLARIESPSRTALLMDSFNANANPHGSNPQWRAVASRYNGRFTVLYADGSTEMVPQSTTPTGVFFAHNASPEQRYFWLGTQNP